jgi:hypothetical protein
MPIEEQNCFNGFQKNRPGSVSIFHAKCVIEEKLDDAAVMLKGKIMAFLKGIRKQSNARRPRISCSFADRNVQCQDVDPHLESHSGRNSAIISDVGLKKP